MIRSTLSFTRFNLLHHLRWLIIIPVLASCGNNGDEPDAYGNFEADTYYLSAETSGKITSFPAEEGELLKTGDLIASLDTTQLFLQKKQLLARIEALKSNLQDIPVQVAALLERQEILEREVNRTRSLLQDSAATQKQLDDLTGELEVVKKQLSATKNQLSTANRSILTQMDPLRWQIRQLDDQLAKSTVIAIRGGTVLEKFKEKGELAMVGQPLVKMADLSKITLRAFISGGQLGEIQIGQKISVQVDGSDGEIKQYAGTITWIASEAEFTPKTIQTREERVNMVYAIKCEITNDGFLKIGMPGEIRF